MYKFRYKNFLKKKFKDLYYLKKNAYKIFKKSKWKDFLKTFFYQKRKKLINNNVYLKPKFGYRFKNKYRNKLFFLKKFQIFFEKLKYNYLKKLFKKSKTKFYHLKNFKKNIFHNSIYFFIILEQRLDFLLFRVFLLNSIKEARFLIYTNKIFLNNKLITIHSKQLTKSDIVSINTFSHELVIQNLIFNRIKFNFNNSIEINFNILTFYIIANLDFKNINKLYPFWLNFRHITKYLNF
uniref:Ribosomal protein S4 n=1 Tax=Melosira undulata TaxID=2133757 RepID=A0A3G1PWF0_9STRA|nr:ribosomal protein S4 [Melosira undulata]AVR57568.1 ribosomal protein S4 [Melosira undulata]